MLKNILTLLIITFISWYWFTGTSEITLDIDEVYYIMNSRFYFYRKNNRMDSFNLPKNPYIQPWKSDQNLLLDQPQLSKYIIGAILDYQTNNDLDYQSLNWLYDKFSTFSLPTKKPSQLNDYLGPEFIKAILIIRYNSSLTSLISLCLIAWAIYRSQKSKILPIFFLAISTFHPLFRNSLRIATTNSFSLLFLSLSSLLILKTLHNLNKISKHKHIFFSLLSGTITAHATSIKINGAFLLIYPLFHLILSILINYQKSKKNLIWLKNFSWFYSFFFIGFAVTFFYLEPELWKMPIKGSLYLIGSRLIQQQRFINFFGSYSYPRSFFTGLSLFISPFQTKIISPILLLILLIGVCELLAQTKKNIWKKPFISLSIFTILINASYAKVIGFERYFIPSIIIYLIIASLGLSKLLTRI